MISTSPPRRLELRAAILSWTSPLGSCQPGMATASREATTGLPTAPSSRTAPRRRGPASNFHPHVQWSQHPLPTGRRSGPRAGRSSSMPPMIRGPRNWNAGLCCPNTSRRSIAPVHCRRRKRGSYATRGVAASIWRCTGGMQPTLRTGTAWSCSCRRCGGTPRCWRLHGRRPKRKDSTASAGPSRWDRTGGRAPVRSAHSSFGSSHTPSTWPSWCTGPTPAAKSWKNSRRSCLNQLPSWPASPTPRRGGSSWGHP